MLEILGLGGGFAALFFGAVLCAAGWAEGTREGGSFLVVCETALLLASAPLLLLGVHCLDVEECRARRARIETQSARSLHARTNSRAAA